MLKGELINTKKTKVVNPEDRFKSSHSETGTKYVKDEERFTAKRVVPAQAGTSSRNSQPPKSNALKYITIFLVLAVLGTGSYFGYDYYQKEQIKAEQIILAEQKAKEEQKLAQEKAQKDQQQAWNQAIQSNTIASYQAYLDKYPNDSNLSEANDKIKKLKAQIGNLTTQVQELLVKLDYQVPTNGQLDARTEAAIKDFEAKQNILVTGKADQVLINSLQSAYSKKDQAAWSTALNKNTIAAFQNYKSQFSEGYFVNQIDEKVRQVKQEKNQKQLIFDIQSELKRLGFENQSIDGQLGNITQFRIKTYQKINKQNDNGKATQDLLTRLKVEEKWPGKLPGETFKECSVCPEMIVITSGSFNMGSNERDIEKPIHKVDIKQFSMSQTEVTFDQWDECYKAGGCSHNPDDMGWGRGNHPVVNVSWNDAQEYIKWLNQLTGSVYRLPSESEWEYAAKAGSNTKYSWGNNINCNLASYGYQSNECSEHNSTAPVKSYNSNNFGLYDMHGNSGEWISDTWHTSYNGAPIDGSAWYGDKYSYKLTRGGSWFSSNDKLCVFCRSRIEDGRFSAIGFRLARD